MVRLTARFMALLGFLGMTLAAVAQDTVNTVNTGGGAAGCVGSLIGGLIGLAIAIGLTYYVYTDAKKRGMDNAGLWAVLTFFTGLIGLIIYLLVRKK